MLPLKHTAWCLSCVFHLGKPGSSGALAGTGAGRSSSGAVLAGDVSSMLGVGAASAAALAAATGGGADDGSAGPDGGGGGDASVVKVVVAQRDRLRLKVQELQEQLVRLQQQLSASQAEAAAAKADAVALVERLRYVGGYKQQQAHGGGGSGRRKGATSSDGRGLDVESSGGGDDVEARYSKLYEEGINPFHEFQGQQLERRKKGMGVPDRVMYSMGQLVFGTPATRLGMFVYLCVLHALVVLLMMRMTHHSSSLLDAHTQHLLDHGRHDATSIMHHDHAVRGGGGGGGAVAHHGVRHHHGSHAAAAGHLHI